MASQITETELVGSQPNLSQIAPGPNTVGQPVILASQQAPQQNQISAKMDDIRANKRNYWKAEEERILASWCDRAQCYEWMHYKAHLKYKSKNAWFTIPVIVISTVTGTANFAQDRFGDEYKDWVVMGVGGANIIAGIITTVYQFLKVSELNEAHRVAALSWGKFCRNLRAELSKHPLDRVNHEHFVSMAKEEYDRLIEISPIVPTYVIKEFNKKYGSVGNFTKPEICAETFGTDVYQMNETERLAMIEELLEDKSKKEREAEIDRLRQQLEDSKRTNHELLDAVDAATAHRGASPIHQSPDGSPSSRDIKLSKFKDTFIKVNGRVPNSTEISTMFNPIYGYSDIPERRSASAAVITFTEPDPFSDV
jgi:hypothetical protein